MNNVILIGRLTKGPELRFLPGDGKAVSNFSIAVDRPFTNSEGERGTDFFKIVVWGRQAENCANYLSKGRLVGIQGRIQTRSYVTDSGQKRYVTEIIANRVQYLDYKSNNANDADGANDEFFPVDEDDIPF